MKSYRDIDYLDFKLMLLAGDDIHLDNFIIPSYTIKEIKDYGFSYYYRNLQWLSLTVDDFINAVEDLEKKMILQAEKSKLKVFDFYTDFGDEAGLEDLLDALSMVFKTEDIRMLDKNNIALGFMEIGILVEDEDGKLVIDKEVLNSIDKSELKIINRDNFDEIIEVVKIINYLEKPTDKSKSSNPADEETEKFIKRMEALKKKVEEKKKRQQNSNDDKEIDVSDVISAITVKSASINKFNVWGLTLYQLYDEYARLEVIDSYDVSIRAMLAGASDVDIHHWSSRL